MIRRKTSDWLPIDLVIIGILPRLPAASIARFRCVSKQWESILHRPCFTELFLTRSHARPGLLFVIKQSGDGWRCYSSLQPHRPHKKSASLVKAAEFHTKVSGHRDYSCGYASGFIYFSSMFDEAVDVICNPSTGKYAILPNLVLTKFRKSYRFLGFDPIDKQHKVLSMVSHDSDDRDHKVMTLGTGTMMWRTIQCPTIRNAFRPLENSGICINGVLYYLADRGDFDDAFLVIVSFDVRSEKFKLIEVDESFSLDFPKLINYKGKLGRISSKYVGKGTQELCMWVLEDVEKRKWVKYVYTLPKSFDDRHVVVAGVTAIGEIVLWMVPFYVFYFNPERNTIQNVEIQCSGRNNGAFEKFTSAKVFVDHVEDISFIS